jgi:hypothetical protein
MHPKAAVTIGLEMRGRGSSSVVIAKADGVGHTSPGTCGRFGLRLAACNFVEWNRALRR